MEFLLVTTFLLYVNALTGLRLIQQEGIGSKLALVHFSICYPLAMAFVVNFLNVGDEYTGYMPLTAFTTGSITVVLFGIKLYKMYFTKPDTSSLGWRSGITALAVVGGLYVSFAVIDHWAFFWDEKSGYASTTLLGIDEIKCDSMVLIRLIDNTAEYRCPTNVVFGGLTPKPFAPWPSYTEGRSENLKTAINSVRNHSVKLPENSIKQK
jgi:hypothetical protein